MGRNLGRSSCCGNIVKLSDLRGKPIEFRRFRNDAPRIGTKWTCPTCRNNYFVIWSDPRQFASSEYEFNLDLSYYSSFSDENVDLTHEQTPGHLCLNDAEDIQDIL